MPQYQTAAFIFRRDLRLADNTALNVALRSAKHVIACFIFDDRQITPHPYQSKPALHFMLQSLADLVQQFEVYNTRLTLLYGLPTQVITQLHENHKIQAIFISRDYTPFSQKRDTEIATVCQPLNIALHIIADALLTEPEQAMKANADPYKVFTAFYNNARKFPVLLPQALENGQLLTIPSTTTLENLADSDSFHSTSIQGGRTAALQQLDALSDCANYAQTRDFPALQSTSQLSAHLKFGTVSIREVFYAITQQLGSEHPLLRQLYWRDFLTHIAYHFPKVFGHAFITKYDNLVWDNNREYFQAWADGKTGFPIVDAGMRELNTTGNMHNRVRMIVASFLVKDLHISWRWGERYFAQHLVDYDPCVNNGNWQWAASTGCDAQPYFRIFNPWLQQQKFDPNCSYIYQWVPELRAVPVKTIHAWEKKYYGSFYPMPIINHAQETLLTKTQFKAADS
ncbi:cryptochrome/photolyase family protein [Crenothrix polyspora]|uniref:Deoxyribodipyrimidine photo-lyase n=1 Tax=Crenothrix polyspora TaxID=360316 RepID=A0A1R4H511_9GAMM|nr:deoxyribodipyrimidine photo-lyase [Crenothrix polyspora]SJM90920.1 Deoxyribodipyrimidine photo-lyase [Crenothrix polyspora]